MSVSNPFEGRNDVFAANITTPSLAREYLEKNDGFPLRLGVPIFFLDESGAEGKCGIGNAHYLAPVSESYFQAVGDVWIPLLDGKELYVENCVALVFFGQRDEIASSFSFAIHKFGQIWGDRVYTTEDLSKQVIGALKVAGTLGNGDFICNLLFYCNGEYLGQISNVVFGDSSVFESDFFDYPGNTGEEDGLFHSEKVLHFVQYENGMYVEKGLFNDGVIVSSPEPVTPNRYITSAHLLKMVRTYASILRDRAIELGVFHYCYSLDGSDESVVQHSLITERYSPTNIPGLLGDFAADNYEVDIPVNDREFLQVLRAGHVSLTACIKIRGVPIDSYLGYFLPNSDRHAEEMLYGYNFSQIEPYFSWRKEAKREIDRIGAEEVGAEILPYWAASSGLQFDVMESLCMHGLPAYEETSPCMYRVRDEEFDAQVRARAKSTWKSRYFELLESGSIRVRWKSEWGLYKLVKSVFDDAQFQYKPEWLRPQSLDIFVPSIRVGIEYQGIEHYKATEFFGGEENFLRRKKLDKNKKELCMENNIKLVEWPYTVPISRDSLKKML